MSNISISENITIKATPAIIWRALTDPEIVKQYMFGTEVVSEWKVGGSLVYKGIWEGNSFEDRGTILEIESEKILKSTYFSPLSGLEDKPENYNTVTYELASEGDSTKLTVTQDNIRGQENADHTAQNWRMILDSIKQLLEK